MKQLIDNDLGILLVFLLAVSLEVFNKYVALVVGVIAILIGFILLNSLIRTFKNNQLERKIKKKQLEDLQH